MSSKVTVRRLSPADREGWLGMWRGYLAFYRAQVDDHVTDETFRRLCDEDRGMIGLVAVDGDDTPVGLAHLVFHASTWAPTPSCYLEDLFVERSARGTGVAESLLAGVEAVARERGANRVYWLTQEFNAPARSLYDKVARLTSFVVYEQELDET